MKKKILVFGFLLAFIVFGMNLKTVSALDIDTGVDGTIIIRWIDYGDPRNERPDTINLVVGERLSPTMQHQTITLNESDAIISVDPNDSAITEWKFTKTGYNNYFFTHHGATTFLYEYTEIENLNSLGYNEIDSQITGSMHPTKYDFNGHVMEEAGTLVVTLVKDTLVTKNLIVTYKDSQARDNSSRNLDFAIKGENVADPVRQNAYYRFQIQASDTLKGTSNMDTYTKSIYISGSDAYQSGNPLIHYIFEEDNQNIPGRNISYQMDGDNILVTVNYQAKTKVVPIEVVWKDNNDQLGLRPNDLLLKAYDQNGNLEKEIQLLENDNWKTNATLYENMIYSNGTPIDYTMELASSNDYKYTVSKDGNGYRITATLKNQQGIVIPNDGNTTNKEENTPITTKNTDSTRKESNPKTGDSIMVYIFLFFLGFSSLAITLKPILKKTK